MHLHVEGYATDGTPAYMFEVYLDGRRLEKCFEADDEAGYALCYKTDEEGRLVLSEDRQSVETIEYRGKVEFRKKTA